MRKTKIPYVESTFNPVSGCFHNCPYCYARKIAERFGGASETEHSESVGTECQWITEANGTIHELDTPIYDYDHRQNAPYPYGFDPTFFRYRLNIPQHWRKPRTIFVCSMADLFGAWTPDSWIEDVFAACAKAPKHRYLFLTKNPMRYVELAAAGKLPKRENMWYGTTVTRQDELFFYGEGWNTFTSIEPIREEFSDMKYMSREYTQWVIIGAETGSRKGKIIPEKEWIDHIAATCRKNQIPVFMKDSLLPVIGEGNLLREFPWDLIHTAMRIANK